MLCTSNSGKLSSIDGFWGYFDLAVDRDVNVDLAATCDMFNCVTAGVSFKATVVRLLLLALRSLYA